MKKNALVSLGICSLVLQLTLGGTAALAADAPPKTDAEKLGYAIGLNISTSLKPLKRMGVDFDQDSLFKGLKTGLSGGDQLMTDAQIEEVIKAMQADIPVKNKKAGEDFLAKNKAAKDVKVLPDGLQYKVINPGNGPIPKMTDSVSVHYRGTFIDGSEFDASPAGQTTSFPVTGVIKGWTEALELMPTGAKWQLYIPSDLAYGPEGRPQIPPNSVLVFDVELVSIAPPAPATPALPPGLKMP